MDIPPERLGPPTTLALCPIGLFVFEDRVGFKPETVTHNAIFHFDQTDAYWVDTGEYFWGHAPAAPERETVTVRPLALDMLLMEAFSS